MATPPPNNRPRPRVSVAAGPGAIDLLEESVHRLRLTRPGVLALYYVGSLPFILGLLFFWADLSRDPDAPRHAIGAAFGLTLLFVWMKSFQAIFASELRARFGRRPSAPWTVARLARLAATQTVLQGTALFVLPVAALITIPLGWVYAFYQNATALGTGETSSTKEVFARSARAAALWPKQNHVALSLIFLLGLFAWINLIAAAFTFPQLLRQFTGEENLFTRSGIHILNTTFFAVTFSLVYLALDPVIKTFYALRCFYGDSLRSGEDLKSELLALPPVSGTDADAMPAPPSSSAGAVKKSAPVLAALLVLAFCLFAPTRAPAAVENGPAPTPAPSPDAPTKTAGVSPTALRQSAEEVLKRREFAWRQPRSRSDIEAPAAGPGFWDAVGQWIKDTWESVEHWLDRFWEKLFGRRRPSRESGNALQASAALLRLAAYGLAVLTVASILFVLWKSWRNRRARREQTGQIVPAAAVINLADDQILASQLPEDEWLELARRLLAEGERRLAVRAFYLSVLSNLGARGLLAIARHKSNRDYLEELRRRARDSVEMREAFARNVRRFERVWYGPHPADDTLMAEFQADRQCIAAALATASAPPAVAPGLPAIPATS
jgi:hypothetical protein